MVMSALKGTCVPAFSTGCPFTSTLPARERKGSVGGRGGGKDGREGEVGGAAEGRQSETP